MKKKKQSWEEFEESTKKSVRRESLERSISKPVGSLYRGGKRVIAKQGRNISRKLTSDSRKRISKRSRGTRNVLTALGAVSGKASGSGAGRPKGSYKYQIGGKPVSVFAWRRYMAQRKQQLAQFQAQSNQRLSQKGFQPEQLQQLRQQRVVQQAQQGKPFMERNMADEELAFREHLANNTVTPNTQQILTALRRTQNKAKSDNIEQQRRHHERNMVGRAMNLMKAHENMVKVQLDMTGVNSDNILMAPSVFRENPENNILRPRERHLLDMRENNLRFFG